MFQKQKVKYILKAKKKFLAKFLKEDIGETYQMIYRENIWEEVIFLVEGKLDSLVGCLGMNHP